MDVKTEQQENVCNETNREKVEEEFGKARSKIRGLFYVQAFGQVLSLGGLLAVQMMQTSLNVEGRKGAIAVTTAFVVTLFVCLFVGPILHQRLKPNTTLILSELGFLVFCASNFYPKLEILLPGAIFFGFGRGLFVPSYSMLFIQLTAHCAKYTKSENQAYYFDQFQSKFYSINEGVQIVGNGLSYAIFYGTYQDQLPITSDNNITLSDNVTNISLYQYCGRNDCQDPSIIANSMHQYVPPSKTSVYIFITSTVLLNIVAIVIHWTIFPGVGAFSHKLSKIDRAVEQSLRKFRGVGAKFPKVDGVAKPSSESGFESGDDTRGVANGSNLAEVAIATEDDTLVECRPRKNQMKEYHGYCRTLKRTFIFMIGGRAILLGIAALHTGMLIGFAFADITRAYASCVAGVHMTGAFAVSFGVAGMISSWIYGKALPLFGRVPIFSTVSAAEVAIYGLCYYWIPDPQDTYVIFIMFIGLGFVNGVIRQNVIAAYTLHFPKNKTTALTAFNTAFIGGFGLQYGLSTFMCVSAKLYVQITLTVLGLISYALAETIKKSGIGTWNKK